MTGRGNAKSNGTTVHIDMGHSGLDNASNKNKGKGAAWRKHAAKEIKIIDVVDTESADLPETRVVKGIQREKHIQALERVHRTGRKDSLTVPGTLPGSSDAKEDQVRTKTDSFSLGRESSKLSVDSRRSLDIRVPTTVTHVPTTDDDKPKSALTTGDSGTHSAIPYLPLGLAVFCLLLNVILPGTGTILSGFSIFCGGKPRVPTKKDEDVIVTLCTNVWVGVAQLFTVTFLLVGWFWSLAWGIKMVILAVERRRMMKEQRAKELQTLALSAFGSNKQVRSLLP